METAYDQRGFNMTYPELVVFARNIANNLTRDFSDLSVFGVVVIKIAMIEVFNDMSEIFPNYNYFDNGVMINASA